jgi:hypothetical protein
MSIEKCSVCGVEIENGSKVNFSCGPSGTRARLWARVCQFTQKDGCINRDETAIGDVASSDYYN